MLLDLHEMMQNHLMGIEEVIVQRNSRQNQGGLRRVAASSNPAFQGMRRATPCCNRRSPPSQPLLLLVGGMALGMLSWLTSLAVSGQFEPYDSGVAAGVNRHEFGRSQNADGLAGV